ncbi:MAG: hypothetical protein WCW00_05560, partial [Candidatus Paceibacterota bacterium]
GLVVLLSAYLLLNTINPALVNLKEPVLLFLDWTEEFGNAAGGGPGGGGSGIPAWCANEGPSGNTIGSCVGYETSHLSDCNADPCRVGRGVSSDVHGTYRCGKTGTHCQLMPI